MPRTETNRPLRAAAIRALALLAASQASALLAVEIRSIGAVRIVPPGAGSEHRQVFTPERLRDRVARLVGTECDPPSIEEYVALPYRFIGFVPSVKAKCDEGELSLLIRESSYRIALIAFDPVELARIGVRPDPRVEDPRRLYTIPEGPERAVARGLLRTREGDLYNHERYRSDSDAVGRAGYTIAFIPGPPTGVETYPAGAYLIRSLTPRADGAPGRRGRTNYIGGTAAFGPRERASVGAVYRRRRLFGRSDLLTFSPDYSTAFGADLTYRAPLIADRDNPRRLYDLEFALFSEFRNNRVLNGIETDQRRNGATVTLGARPLGLPASHDLRLLLGVAHQRIDFDEPVPGVEESDLTVLSAGITYEWRHTDRWPSMSARRAPRLDVSLDGAGGQRSFVRGGLDATLHPRLPSGLEFDLHLSGGFLNGDVPGFELWSLGGATTVRGFREDEFLGRNMAALQAEIWLPFVRPLPERASRAGAPLPEPSELPLQPRAARLLKWAVFLDGGYVSGIPGAGNEAIFGAGLGLRFVVPRRPLVMRLDYGWGLGGLGDDSHPYVSIGYRF
ncbi:MAG: BamA/TamA family outer membrane protein [Acidobacteriota bacterium]